jgi:hypothetical protein
MKWLAAFAAVLVAVGIALYMMTRSSPPTAPPVAAPIATPSTAMPSIVTTSAPPALPPSTEESSARREREQVLSHIRDPHVGHEHWNDRANRVLDDLARDGEATLERGCYMAGCFATVRFNSDAVEQAAIARVQSSADYTAWTGAKRITPNEESADGKIIIALVLERPD